MAERSYLIVTISPAKPEQVFDLLADARRWREWAGSSIAESAWVSGATGEVGAVRTDRRRHRDPLVGAVHRASGARRAASGALAIHSAPVRVGRGRGGHPSRAA
jgi:hypothetical protein